MGKYFKWMSPKERRKMKPGKGWLLWIECLYPLSSVHIEILIPSVMELGGEDVISALWKEGGVLMSGVSALRKDTVEPLCSNLIQSRRLRRDLFENWITFVAWGMWDWSYRYQHERVVGSRTKVLFKNWGIFSMNNLVENWIVWDRRRLRTVVWSE